MDSKVCKRCGKEKSLDEYYTHKTMADGHLNFCKDCVKKRVSQYREENIEKIHEYDRIRSQTDKRKAKRTLETAKRRKQVKWYQKGHNAIERAVSKGELVRANVCQVCGKVGKTEGHHSDYGNPKSVIWLCRTCHSQYHTGKSRTADIVKAIINNMVILKEARQAF